MELEAAKPDSYRGLTSPGPSPDAYILPVSYSAQETDCGRRSDLLKQRIGVHIAELALQRLEHREMSSKMRLDGFVQKIDVVAIPVP